MFEIPGEDDNGDGEDNPDIDDNGFKDWGGEGEGLSLLNVIFDIPGVEDDNYDRSTDDGDYDKDNNDIVDVNAFCS